MPMTRILDISMTRPFLGMVFGYGHFVFGVEAQASCATSASSETPSAQT